MTNHKIGEESRGLCAYLKPNGYIYEADLSLELPPGAEGFVLYLLGIPVVPRSLA